MWGRWWCFGGVFGSLKQRVSAIVNINHGYREKLHPFDYPLLALTGCCCSSNMRWRGRMGGIFISCDEPGSRGLYHLRLLCKFDPQGSQLLESSLFVTVLFVTPRTYVTHVRHLTLTYDPCRLLVLKKQHNDKGTQSCIIFDCCAILIHEYPIYQNRVSLSQCCL